VPHGLPILYGAHTLTIIWSSKILPHKLLWCCCSWCRMV